MADGLQVQPQLTGHGDGGQRLAAHRASQVCHPFVSGVAQLACFGVQSAFSSGNGRRTGINNYNGRSAYSSGSGRRTDTGDYSGRGAYDGDSGRRVATDDDGNTTDGDSGRSAAGSGGTSTDSGTASGGSERRSR